MARQRTFRPVKAHHCGLSGSTSSTALPVGTVRLLPLTVFTIMLKNETVPLTTQCCPAGWRETTSSWMAFELLRTGVDVNASQGDGGMTAVEGWSRDQTITLVWINQSLLMVVYLWGWWEVTR